MRIAIVGFGSVGKRHLNNLLLLGIKDIVLVSSHLKTRIYNINGSSIPVENEIASILGSVNAIVISNETSLHHEYLNLAVRNNIHVYIEKPIACNTNQIKNIFNEVIDRKVIVAVGTQFRFNKRLIKLKALLEDGDLGEIISVMSTHGEHIADYHPKENFRASYSANKDQCGGVLLTQIHHIDYIDWLFGPFTHSFANEMPAPSLGIDTDAIINYSLISRKTNLQVHGHLNYLQRPKSTKLFVIGDKGVANWDYESNALTIRTSSGQINDTEVLDRNDMFIESMHNFLESIRLSKMPHSNLKTGIRSLKIVESIRRSIVNQSADQISDAM